MTFYDQVHLATCEVCSGTFDRPESERWKSKCFPCWKRSKASTNSSGQAQHQRSKTSGSDNMDWWQRGYAAGRAAALEMSEATPAPLDRARIRQLLQLCHPDRHDQSPLAGEVTTWLLSMRGKQ